MPISDAGVGSSQSQKHLYQRSSIPPFIYSPLAFHAVSLLPFATRHPQVHWPDCPNTDPVRDRDGVHVLLVYHYPVALEFTLQLAIERTHLLLGEICLSIWSTQNVLNHTRSVFSSYRQSYLVARLHQLNDVPASSKWNDLRLSQGILKSDHVTAYQFMVNGMFIVWGLHEKQEEG